MVKLNSNFKIMFENFDLNAIEIEHVKNWAAEESAKCYLDEHGFVVWHTTDYDPVGKCDKRLLIDFIFVNENSRRQRNGQKLLDVVKDACGKNNGMAAITSNDESELFFIDYGFKKVATYHPLYFRALSWE